MGFKRTALLLQAMALLGGMACFAGINDILAPVKQEIPAPGHGSYVGETREQSMQPQAGGVIMSTPQSTKLSQTELVYELTSILTKRFQLDGKLKLYPQFNWKPITISSPVWNVELINTVPGKISSKMIVFFQIKSSGKIIGSWKTPVFCELWQDVYTLSKPLNRGSAIQSEYLKVATVDTLKHTHALVKASEKITHYELDQTVSADEPLEWGQLKKIPMIRTGQIVDLVANEGIMSISTKGRAMQEGTSGDFITVRNLESKRDIQAQVIDENTVKVYF